MFHIFTSFYKTKKALEFYLSLNPSYSIFIALSLYVLIFTSSGFPGIAASG